MVFKKELVEDDVLTLARRRIREAYDLFDRIVVSFSGGKDSTVVLNLALEVARERCRLPLDVFFWDEEAIPPETIDYVHRVHQMPEVRLRWLALPVKHRNGCSRQSPWWRPFDPACPELWCREPPPFAERDLPGFTGESIPMSNRLVLPASGGSVGLLLGVRADESVNRFRSVMQKSADNWFSWETYAPWIAKCKPIYDWTSEDVWLAPHLLGWDYNTSYDLMSAMGLTPNQQRVAPPYGEEPMQRLYSYQLCWPELWDKMSRRVPGAATAARYSRTELYNFGKVNTLGESGEMSWKESIGIYLMRWNEPERTAIAKNLRWSIEYHFKHTRDPIPEADVHPDSGVSWKYLAMLASRGDLKGRRKPRPAGRAPAPGPPSLSQDAAATAEEIPEDIPDVADDLAEPDEN